MELVVMSSKALESIIQEVGDELSKKYVDGLFYVFLK